MRWAEIDTQVSEQIRRRLRTKDRAQGTPGVGHER